MNPEMMEALDALAESRGISKDALFAALAEALEAAYKKQNDDYEFVWVNIDTETGEMRVFAQELDEDNLPTGPEMDVTPDDFGRIAAQTVRQVMSQRIREVERDLGGADRDARNVPNERQRAVYRFKTGRPFRFQLIKDR